MAELGPLPTTALPTCAACATAGLYPVLDLGSTPLANSLRTEADLQNPEPTFPLAVFWCPNCTLVQLGSTVDPSSMFPSYPYFSSVSETVVENARAITSQILSSTPIGADDLVAEIASNDGYLLQFYQKQGIRVLGIEPAANIAEVAEKERHIPTLQRFFSLELARELRTQGLRAKVIHANNVLAHVPQINQFVGGLAAFLANDGQVVIEVPYLFDLIEGSQFDTIYHEHVFYFSLTALCRLFGSHGLAIYNVERIPIHGGSIRIFASHQGARPLEPAVARLLAEETQKGVHDGAAYDRLRTAATNIRKQLPELLKTLKNSGARIAAYGAAAKGATLLNYCGIGRDLLDFVVDKSPHKQGRYMPGSSLLIRHPDALIAEHPEFCLLLAWNMAAEVRRQQTAYTQAGGRFLRPHPTPGIATE